MLLFQEFYERCGKAIGIGIILSKRKGGIYMLGDPPETHFSGFQLISKSGGAYFLSFVSVVQSIVVEN